MLNSICVGGREQSRWTWHCHLNHGHQRILKKKTAQVVKQKSCAFTYSYLKYIHESTLYSVFEVEANWR